MHKFSSSHDEWGGVKLEYDETLVIQEFLDVFLNELSGLAFE